MGKKILAVLAENDIKQELKKNGYTIVEALEGYRAMSLALSEKPDMVIIDVRIPAGGGFNLYENMRKSSFTAKTPILFIAGAVDDALIAKVRNGVAVDFLAKPFAVADVLGKIKRMLPRRNDPPETQSVIDITI